MPAPCALRSTEAAGSEGETNFGTTSVAAPHAVSSRVVRYSFTARLDLAGSRSLRQSSPAIERCLLASTWIRLASTAKPSPPTRPAARHASTTRSNTRRKTSPSRKRSLRARENARTADRPPNGQAPLDLQPPPVADGLRRHPSYTPVYRHSDQPAWSDASSASIEDGEAHLS